MNPVSPFPFNQLCRDMRMSVLSHMPPADLISFSETSKTNYGLIHGTVALVRKMRKPFCVIKPFREKKDPRALAQRAIALITKKGDEATALYLQAKAEPTPANLRRALEAALSMKTPRDRVLADLSEHFPIPECAEHIHGIHTKALCFLELAEREKNRENRINLLLRAVDFIYQSNGCFKTVHLYGAWLELRKLLYEKADDVLVRFIKYLAKNKENTYHQKFIDHIVSLLKTSDVDMARIVAVCTPAKAFDRLMTIARANLRKDPQKADEIFREAISIKFNDMPSRYVGQIVTIIQFYQAKGESKKAWLLCKKTMKAIQKLKSETGWEKSQKKRCETIIANALVCFNKEEAIKYVKTLETEYFTVRILQKNFPERARQLALEAFHRTFAGYPGSLRCRFLDAQDMGAVDSKIIDLFFEGTIKLFSEDDECYLGNAVTDASLLHRSSPKKGRALFKWIINRAEKVNRREKIHVFHQIATRIARLYPKIAAGLYQEIYEMDKNPTWFIQMAELVSEHALDLLSMAIREGGNLQVSQLKEIAEMLLNNAEKYEKP